MPETQHLYSNEKVLLKTSFFGGFEKREVLTYIDKLREQNQLLGKELDTNIQELATARSQLSEQVSSFEAKISEMEHQLDERGGKIRELAGIIETLRGEVSQQKMQHIEREKELHQQKEQNRQLAVQVKNYEYKAKCYEEVSAQLGDIMLEANQRANATIAQAQNQAEQIKANAVTASQKITAEMSMMRGELSSVRTQIEDLMQNFTRRLDDIDRMLVDVVPSGNCDKAEKLKAAAIAVDSEEPAQSTAVEEPKPAQSFFRAAATM